MTQAEAPNYRTVTGQYEGSTGVFIVSTDGTDVRDSFQLASANVAAAPVTVYGGDYILSQSASAYGTIALQVLGPDGATWQTLISKTASDSTGGTGLALGAGASVRALLTGTTSAAVILSRVPA